MLVRVILMSVMLFYAVTASAQGIMGDVFSGKLINPEVGVYSWYDLTDSSSGKQFYLRLAIVGEEKVKGKTGYWFEVELLPRVGFPAVYKMLLTGPASDSKNVHRIVMKEGDNTPVDMDPSAMASGIEQSKNAKRNEIGEEEVITQIGTVIADHVVMEENGITTDIWLNDEVRPMGLVKMSNSQGELILRNYGQGGEHAVSAMERTILPPANNTAGEPVNEAPMPDNNSKIEIIGEPVEEIEEQPEEPMQEVEPAEEMPQDSGETETVEEEKTESPNVVQGKDKSNDDEEESKSRKSRHHRGFGARPR